MKQLCFPFCDKIPLRLDSSFHIEVIALMIIECVWRYSENSFSMPILATFRTNLNVNKCISHSHLNISKEFLNSIQSWVATINECMHKTLHVSLDFALINTITTQVHSNHIVKCFISNYSCNNDASAIEVVCNMETINSVKSFIRNYHLYCILGTNFKTQTQNILVKTFIFPWNSIFDAYGCSAQLGETTANKINFQNILENFGIARRMLKIVVNVEILYCTFDRNKCRNFWNCIATLEMTLTFAFIFFSYWPNNFPLQKEKFAFSWSLK